MVANRSSFGFMDLYFILTCTIPYSIVLYFFPEQVTYTYLLYTAISLL